MGLLCPYGQALLPHMVTSAQMAGSHPQVPTNRQNEQPPDASRRGSSLRRPPAAVRRSTAGQPAEEFLPKLTRSLKTTLCSCSIHLSLLITKIRAKFLLLTSPRASVPHPLPFSPQCKAAVRRCRGLVARLGFAGTGGRAYPGTRCWVQSTLSRALFLALPCSASL